MKILNKIQTELKAPKGQYNGFNKFHYRSCEDILEAVKPFLKKYEATLVINDEVVLVGNRYYIKATATLTSADGTNSASAFAREEETRKSFDAPQITGSASSYARKYALNGLFAIDDTKDADALGNNQVEKAVNAERNIATEESIYNELSKAKNKEELGKLSRELLNKKPSLKEQIVKAYNDKLAEFVEAEK